MTRLEEVREACHKIEAREMVSDLVKEWADPKSVTLDYHKQDEGEPMVQIWARCVPLDQSILPPGTGAMDFATSVGDDEDIAAVLPIRIRAACDTGKASLYHLKNRKVD